MRPSRRFRPPWATRALAGLALSILVLTPTAHGAARLAARLATAATTLSRRASRAPANLAMARLFQDTPAVGALFHVSAGRLGAHFCTASVVDSPDRDLVITAAHCVSGQRPSAIAFVPGYHNGRDPYGVWFASRIVVDSQWRKSRNPDHDVAFLVVGQPGRAIGVQSLTGGEQLGTGWAARAEVRVTGYPDGSRRPVVCTSETLPFGWRQMRFDCGGYTDGTSGGPFVARWNSLTGEGTVIGVIGRYEQGGYLASVSYSPRFGPAVRSLYQTATAEPPP